MNTAPVDHFKNFIAEMRAHSEFKHHADKLEHALAHDDLIADTNSIWRGFLTASDGL
jgi:hypothetical protein